MPSTTDVATQLIDRGLFAFDQDAIAELSRVQALEDDVDDLLALTAAELALSPVLAQPRELLPAGRTDPVRVDAEAARLAIVKANCVSLLVHCVPPRRLSDALAFGGDISKLARVGFTTVAETAPEVIGDLARAVDQLEDMQVRSEAHPIVSQVAMSGVLRVQGFLWAIKLAAPLGDPFTDVVAGAYDAFELTTPTSTRVGGGVPAG